MGLDIELRWEDLTLEELERLRESGAVVGLRSAYHRGGFEPWAEFHLDGRGYGWIFGRPDASVEEVTFGGQVESRFAPAWGECRARAQEALAAAKTLPPFLCVPLPRARGSQSGLPSRRTVLSAFLGTRNRPVPPTENALGIYFRRPLSAAAVMWCLSADGSPEPILVSSEEDPHAPYVQALEEALAFIDLGESRSAAVMWSE